MNSQKTIEQRLDEKYGEERKKIEAQHKDPQGKIIPGHEGILKEELTALDIKYDSRINSKIEKARLLARFGAVERD